MDPQQYNFLCSDSLVHHNIGSTWQAACFEAIHHAWLLRSCNLSLHVIHLPTYPPNYICHGRPLLCSSSLLRWLSEGDTVWFSSFTDVEKCFTTSHLKCIAKMLPCLGCIEKVYKETRWLKLEGFHWLLRLWMIFFFFLLFLFIFQNFFNACVLLFSKPHNQNLF